MGVFSELDAAMNRQAGALSPQEAAEIEAILNSIYESRESEADEPAWEAQPDQTDRTAAPSRQASAAGPAAGQAGPQAAGPEKKPAAVAPPEKPCRTQPAGEAERKPAPERKRTEPPEWADLPPDPAEVFNARELDGISVFSTPDGGYLNWDPVEQDPAAWPVPAPPDRQQSLPEFPVACLPPFVATWVQEVATATQTPVAMAGLSALAVLAGCVQGRYDCQVRRSWRETLSLYTVASAKSGERKSSVFDLLIRPVRDYERSIRREERTKADLQRSARRTLEQKLELAQKAAASGKGDETTVQELAAELSTLEVSAPLQILVDDCTPEKLSALLAEHPGGLLEASPEGGIFQMMKGTKDRPPNLDVFLKAWAGESIRVERLTRGTVVADAPHLSILLTVQPSVLQSVVASDTLMNRGLCARFLYVCCESRIGWRDPRPPEVTDAAAQAYARGIARLLRGEDSGTLRLSPEADLELQYWQRQIELALASDWDDDAMQAWGNKLAGQTVRIACLLHIADVPDPVAEPVPVDTFYRAERIAKCLARHAEAVFRGRNDWTDDLHYAMKRLQQLQKKHPVLTRSIALRGMQRLQPVKKFNAVLQALERAQYIRTRTELLSGTTATQIIELNPHAPDFTAG